MIGETQLEMESLKVVAFIYPFSVKTGSSEFNPICNQNLLLHYSIAGVYVQF